MANIDEAFAALSDVQSVSVNENVDFVVDSYLRVISIPVRGVVLGVEGDKDVNRVTFRMSRTYKGVDMSQFQIRINYANANNELNYFKVTEITVSDDEIVFVWVVGADAVAYVGNVEFVVRFIKLSGSNIIQELNTTLATAKSLIGLSVDGEISPVQREDLLAHFYNEIDAYSETKKNEILDSIPEDYTALANEVDELKGDLADIIDKQKNLWKNGNVTKPYVADAQYQSAYYDIELEDGDYYFQYDSVSGAVGGSIQIFPYGKDTDIISNIGTDIKHGTFSPSNGGIRIYFFATLNTVATEAGTAVWSGIKLVKGTGIEPTVIKESALPEFYQTLPTVIPQIEKDSKKSALFDDIATVVETENLWKNGDVEIPYSQGQTWIAKKYNIPLNEGEKYTLKYNSASGYTENAGIVQIFPYGQSTGFITNVLVGTERTFVSPKNGVTIFFFAAMGTSASSDGIAKWSGIELQKGEEIKPNKEVTVNYDVLPDIVKGNKIAEDFEITSETFTSGDSLSLVVSNSKSRNQIGFDATIDSMGTITIYYGNTMAFNDCKVVINQTEVVSYICTQAWVEKARGNHGLTLAHHITVRIANGNNKRAIISITDETGTVYELETNWACGHGDIVVENQSGSYSKCKLTFYPSEYKEKVWAYGDSYFDLWPWICNEKGAKSWMIDGFSGRGSADALKSLKIALKKSTPSIVLWCMGMNDPDSTSAINSTWLDTLNEVKTICDEKQITLIPTTIPNVPSRNHTFKNDYIRENFDRYIDISESLGAEVSTSWYNGLLPDGDIHPSDKGRMLIAQKIMSEVPEIM